MYATSEGQSCPLMERQMAHDMTTLEALDEALDALHASAAQTDTASPEGHRVRLAIDVITALTEQRGCEHFDPAVKNGRLTTLSDVIVFG
jgi:hypothetical protein